MVDYSKFDGIADSDEETTEPIELGTTREAGNALFKQKKYAAAIATYSAFGLVTLSDAKKLSCYATAARAC